MAVPGCRPALKPAGQERRGRTYSPEKRARSAHLPSHATVRGGGHRAYPVKPTGLPAMRGRGVIIDDSCLADPLRRRGIWANHASVTAVVAEQYNAIFVRSSDEGTLRARWGYASVDALLAHYRDAGDATFVPRSRKRAHAAHPRLVVR